jgi:serine/threonine protein kinase
VLSGFNHRAIVRIYELIEANGTAYMVMEHIEGESYEARLRRIGWESSQESLWRIISPLMDGLGAVHSRGFLHRDIKPDNILIRPDGKPVLIDFGSAREAVSQTVTMTSIVTHGYSPVEQYQTKGRVGPWTDIYALGALMCRAVTGDKPQAAPDRIGQDDFAWLRFANPGSYSTAFLGAIDWTLQVNAEDRPQQIGQLRPYFEGDIDSVPPQLGDQKEELPTPSREFIHRSDAPVVTSSSSSKMSWPTFAVLFVMLAAGLYFLPSSFTSRSDQQGARRQADLVSELERIIPQVKAQGLDTRQLEESLNSLKSGDQPTVATAARAEQQAEALEPTSTYQEARKAYEMQSITMLANQARAAGYTGLTSDPSRDPEAWRQALEEGIEIEAPGGQSVVFKIDGDNGPRVAPPAARVESRPKQSDFEELRRQIAVMRSRGLDTTDFEDTLQALERQHSPQVNQPLVVSRRVPPEIDQAMRLHSEAASAGRSSLITVAILLVAAAAVINYVKKSL